MKNLAFFLPLLLSVALVFSFCKKDKDDDGPCGLIGTWKYTETDPNDPGYSYTETLTFTETNLTIIGVETVDGETEENSEAFSYTVDANCTTITAGGQTESFTITGNTLNVAGGSYSRQ